MSFSYDAIGNPLSDGTWTYTWEHGRQLASMTNGGTTWTYTYDANGMRTKRTNGTMTYSYVYNGSQLSQMTVGNHMLNFTYDASGTPMTVNYNGTEYYYVTNLQGDVVALLDSTGTAVVQYTYDAWGNILTITGTKVSTLGTYNPLRYRGYVYDRETGLYYLQSRYYDPIIGRFLNADIVFDYDAGLQGYNLFTYCGNNPVNRIDISGADSIDLIDGDKEEEPELKGGSGGNGRPSGGGGDSSLWSGFRQTISGTFDNLTQAYGERTGSQMHHVFSDKNSTYTPQFEEITDNYGLSLHGKWNIISVQDHCGRHTNAYHESMLLCLSIRNCIKRAPKSTVPGQHRFGF